MRALLLLPALLSALPALPACAAELEPDVDRLFAPYAQPDMPGCAVGLFDHGRTVLAKGYGAADLAWNAPVTPDTRFELGSAAKQFTALALLMLQRDGRLLLADPVRKHLPALPRRYDGITLEHMMRHTSGLPDYIHLARLAQAPALAELTRANALALADSVPMLYQPGDDFAYNNTAYLLLADVVAAAGGQPFAAFLADRIFQPLGMQDTAVIDASRPSTARATLYDVDGHGRDAVVRDGEWRGRDAPGAWGIRTTIRDLGRYHAALADTSGMLAPYLAAMHAPGRLNGGERVTYGAGLYVGSYRGVPAVRHPGRGNVDFMRFPDAGRAVAVMCNRTDADAEALAEGLADIFLADALAPPGAAAGAARASGLAGDYLAESGEHMRIVRADDRLELEGWGPLHEAEGGALTAGPSTDHLRLTVSGDAGRRRLTATFQSSRPVVFRQFTPVSPSPAALRALAGTYRNDALRTVYTIEARGAGPVLVAPDRTAMPLEPLTPDWFAAGPWRVHVRHARDGRVAAIGIGSGRTPLLAFFRTARRPAHP